MLRSKFVLALAGFVMGVASSSIGKAASSPSPTPGTGGTQPPVVVLECEDNAGISSTYFFDRSLLEGAQPSEATIRFTIGNGKEQVWTTAMFMVLNLRNEIFVQFRKDGPWNEIDFHVSPGLTSASADVQIQQGQTPGYTNRDIKCNMY